MMAKRSWIFSIVACVGIAAVILIPRYQQAQAKQEKRQKLYQEAQEYLEKAAASRSKSEIRDLRMKAVRIAEEILDLNSKDPEALLLVARNSILVGNYSKSADAFAVYLEAQQPGAELYGEAGIAWKERWALTRNVSDRIRAQEYLEKSLEERPDNATALFHLGWIWHRERDLKKRDEVWNKLFEAASESVLADEARALLREESSK